MNTQPGRWCLDITDKSGDVRSIPLNAPGEWLVGRSRRCDIVIEDPGVSRRQLIIAVRPDHVEISAHKEASAVAMVHGRPLAAGQSVALESSVEILFAGIIINLRPETSRHEQEGRPPLDPETPALEEHGGIVSQATAALPGDGLIPPESPEETSALPGELTGEQTMAGGASLAPTRMAPATMVTRAAMEPESMAVEQESYGTAFLAEDEAKAMIAAHASRKRNRMMTLVLGSLGMLVLALILLAGLAPGGDPVEHEATYFSLAMPAGWKASSSGDMTIFRPGGGVKAGVAVWRMQDQQVWGFDYEAAFDRILDGMSGLWTGQWPDLTWDPWLSGDNLPEVQQPGESGVAYILRRGTIEGGGTLMIRIYLVRDQIVAVAAWRFSGAADGPLYDVLDSFRLNETIVPDHVVRDIEWPAIPVSAGQTTRWLDDARYLFDQRGVDPGNAFRAYRKALELTGAVDDPSGIAMIWRDHVMPYAAHLQERYLALRAPVLAAVAARDHDASAALARELQALIPDRKDPRWIWAQRILTDAEAASGRSRRF